MVVRAEVCINVLMMNGVVRISEITENVEVHARAVEASRDVTWWCSEVYECILEVCGCQCVKMSSLACLRMM